VQKALALAGIDTFAPSLLGYGRSTRFNEGLNDPGNASLRGYDYDGPTCPYPYEGCDRTLIPGINPLDQQGTMLFPNPLRGLRRAHSSKFRFARTDVWVRDIDQVIDDAIERNKVTYPGGGSSDERKVALVGYSLGGQHVGRTLYADNANEQLLYADDDLKEDLHNRDKVIDKVSRAVFLNSFFGVRVAGIGPTEEPDPFIPPTFPMTLDNRAASDELWKPFHADAACPGRVIEDTKQKVWDQTMANDTVGRTWGTTPWEAGNTGGLNRSPTFSGYGWNREVARKLSLLTEGDPHPIPALVIQGLEDGVLPTGPGTGRVLYTHLFEDPEVRPKPKKVLVEVECGSHVLQWEGCDSTGAACTPHYKTFQSALIEWIKNERFNNDPLGGIFNVNRRGQVTKVSTA
jgi:pimeloyl-ACP methyl ester carboxylesterase